MRRLTSLLLVSLFAFLAVPSLFAADSAEVLVTVDSSGPSTRLVVTKMGRVLHAIT